MLWSVFCSVVHSFSLHSPNLNGNTDNVTDCLCLGHCLFGVVLFLHRLWNRKRSSLCAAIFPQAVSINGFTGATLGSAIVGEFLRHVMQRNFAFFSSGITDVTTATRHISLQDLTGMVSSQSMIVAMKEIYGWLLIISIASFLIILISSISMKRT